MGLYRPILVTAECGTLTRAAKLLGYTQPSLSYVISGIEADLGVKLFTRDQRGMRLTKAGKQAIDLMRQMEELDQRLREAVHAGEQDLLRVGIFTGVSSQWLPGILSAFFARFPDTRVKLVQQRYYLDGELGVKKGTLDCAFYPGSAPSGLACVPLHQDSYYLITGENHFLGGRKSISPPLRASTPEALFGTRYIRNSPPRVWWTLSPWKIRPVFPWWKKVWG